MARLKLSPPWDIHAQEITQLFKYDPEVHVVYDSDNYKVRLYVDDAQKAAALDLLIGGTYKKFGNVDLCIDVYPADIDKTLLHKENMTRAQAWDYVFRGNGAFSFIKRVTGVFTNNITYVVFRNKVVQYYNDDLSDIYGQCSTLYQTIARDVFGEIEGVFFCTDVEEPVYENVDSLDTSLIEWP